MESLLIPFFAGAVILSFIKTEKINQIGLLLAYFGLSTAVEAGFDEDPSLPIMRYSLLAIPTLSLFGSWLTTKWAKFLPLIASLLAFIPIGAKATFGEFEIEWTAITALLVVAGAAFPYIATFKERILNKWFGNSNQTLIPAVSLVGLGVLWMFSNFLFSTYGVFLLATGFIASSFSSSENNQRLRNVSWLLLVLIWIQTVPSQTELFDGNWMKGNTVMGMLIGAGATLLIQNWSEGKGKIVAFILALILTLTFIGIGTVNANFGGVHAFFGVLLGTAFTIAFSSHTSTLNKAYLSLFLLIQPHIFAHFTPVKVKKETLVETTTTSEEGVKKDVFDTPAIALTEKEAGNWKIISDNSKLEFELGPKGNRTSGAFNAFKTDATIDKSGNLTALKVSIKANDLTTFDSYRDESVHGESYINVAKFPSISYTSKNITKAGDRYTVDGELNFLGVKKSVTVELQFVSKGEKNGKSYVVFVGKGSVDRTAFGMTPDSKIGNVVDLTFEVALQQ